MKKLVLSVLASAAIFATGCGNNTNLVAPIAPAQAQTSTVTQVEFLARPGIGEALLFTNSFLNTYNAINPRFQRTVLDNPNGPEAQAAGPLISQARSVLDLLEQADGNVNGLTTDQILAAFIPDVMRIETAGTTADGFRNNGTSNPSYGTFNNAGSTLSYGRKLTDDVIDITLNVLTDGAIQSDQVPYYKPANGPGSTNPNIGHQRLNGQTTNFGPSSFPFLAPPN
ncbi:MAG TPA: DUF4331 domain-containing protein [Phycisphaerales bacterium]|nr:DUF4331 domain-containing protein [Phycisphaerales bacterium]